MEDRELLEMAAKAVGLVIWKHGKTGGGFVNNRAEAWNPLTDDGDALRLVITLKMDLMFFRGFEEVCVQGEGTMDTPYELGEPVEVNEKFGDDMTAITRRAIVRAAAEIGKTMP